MTADTDRTYLRVSLIVLAILISLAPPSIERQLLRHIREVIRVTETGLEEHQTPRDLAAAVGSYIDNNRGRITRLKSYINAYNTKRSLVAYRRLEPGIEALGQLAREHPEIGEEVFQVLWDLMP